MTEVRQAEVQKRRGISIVWLIPVIAALIGGGIVMRTLQDRGPVVTIRFDDASGLEAGKTRIKYKSLEVGSVDSIVLASDLSHVVVTAELVAGAERHLNDETVFWVVRPELSLGHVSGLDTLVSGSYIGIVPGAGEPKRSFVGLEKPPLGEQHRGGLAVVLTASRLGGLSRGAAVYYRNIEVGQVEHFELASDGESVDVHAIVDRKYAHLVRTSTQFWSASGIEVSVGAGGVSIETESFAAVLSGGISFDNPANGGEPVEPGARFDLFDSRSAARAARASSAALVVYVESYDAGGLSEGAPVYYRQQKIGNVGVGALTADARTMRFPLYVERRFAALIRENSRFWNTSGVRLAAGVDGFDLRTGTLASMLAGGIRVATPNDPAERAGSGHLFALHDEAEPAWRTWAPTIALRRGAAQVQHVAAAPGPRKGLEIELEAPSVGSLRPGSPVYYRDTRVGRVGDNALASDGRTVRVRMHIDAEYAHLVRENTRFWNLSGIRADFGIGGLDVQMGSVESILKGGVAFATPDPAGARVVPGAVFELYERRDAKWLEWAPALYPDSPEPQPGAAPHVAAARGSRWLPGFVRRAFNRPN